MILAIFPKEIHRKMVLSSPSSPCHKVYVKNFLCLKCHEKKSDPLPQKMMDIVTARLLIILRKNDIQIPLLDFLTIV